MIKNLIATVGYAQVQSLIWEDFTCCRATKSMWHNYWACVLEPRNHNYWPHVPWSPCPARRKATAMRGLTLQVEKRATLQGIDNTAINKIHLKKKVLFWIFLNQSVMSLLMSWKWSKSQSCSSMSNSLQPQNTRVGRFAFSRESSQPTDWTQVSHFACRFITCWATREAQKCWSG